MLFEHLSLSKSIQRALVKVNYTEATPVQEKVIPEVLRRNDVIGVAQTGTGKTGAYAIPIVNLLNKSAKKAGEKKILRALVIAPTRELAVQINENFRGYSQYTDLRSAVVFGGASIQPQKELV
ncbi:MAG TPA: DEAD/DEAH box helicase, partial [Salinimicrobium sp.]|nr:DEAD/DEAH box helicase [Salinimicrobium sp.]